MNSCFSPQSFSLRCAIPALAVSLLAVPIGGSAAILFSDNFNADTSAQWTVNRAPASVDPAKQTAQFAFDYSPFGIPPAPGSSDTLGLRLRANLPLDGGGNEVTTRPAGTTSGLSVSPTGKNFGNSYHLSFYAWANFNGAPNASGLADNANSEGGTFNLMFAVGTSGTVPLVVANTSLVTDGQMDGIGFATTCDGGITSDYRVYPKSGTFTPAATPGVYAAGSVANSAEYYVELFPAVSAPAVQQAISTTEFGGDAFNTQAGQTQPGAFGFAWHKVDIFINGASASWTIDYTPIANLDLSAIAPGGNNIALGVSDVNSTTTRHPSLAFAIIDNLVVTDLAEPTIQSSVSNGNINLSWLDATAGNFILQSTENLTPPIVWNDVTESITTNSGVFSVSIPMTNSQTFFRLTKQQ